MADAKRIRDIKIKTGVVKRLAKEKTSYEKEAVMQGQKVEKMKTDDKDEHDIRKQIEVLEESQMMIPDCERRLGIAWDELTKLLETEQDLHKTEEYSAAKEILVASKENAKR